MWSHVHNRVKCPMGFVICAGAARGLCKRGTELLHPVQTSLFWLYVRLINPLAAKLRHDAWLSRRRSLLSPSSLSLCYSSACTRGRKELCRQGLAPAFAALTVLTECLAGSPPFTELCSTHLTALAL